MNKLGLFPATVLLLLLRYTLSQSSCITVTCSRYDPNNGVCWRPTPGPTQLHFELSHCPEGKFCNVRSAAAMTNVIKCQPLGTNGTACSWWQECLSGKCVAGRCASRLARKGERATSASDCDKGLYRDPITSTCQSLIPAGYKCGNNSAGFYTPCRDNQICNDGICWPAMVFENGQPAVTPWVCKSLYMNLTTRLCADPPQLLGAKRDGTKRCTEATKNVDCRYRSNSGTYTASQLKKSCLCSMYSEQLNYYCELGEGDEVYVTNVRNVSYEYDSFIAAQSQGQGSARSPRDPKPYDRL